MRFDGTAAKSLPPERLHFWRFSVRLAVQTKRFSPASPRAWCVPFPRFDRSLAKCYKSTTSERPCGEHPGSLPRVFDKQGSKNDARRIGSSSSHLQNGAFL